MQEKLIGEYFGFHVTDDEWDGMDGVELYRHNKSELVPILVADGDEPFSEERISKFCLEHNITTIYTGELLPETPFLGIRDWEGPEYRLLRGLLPYLCDSIKVKNLGKLDNQLKNKLIYTPLYTSF